MFEKIQKKFGITKNVFVLGLVSFFNDFAAEMVYPIVPIFLTAVLGVSMPIVGLIEGIAEATASFSKYLFGALSDFTGKRKPFVVAGYTFATLGKLFIALSYSWPLVLISRVIDRVGKGLRTAPRDSLLLENATPQNKGFIFGFNRAFDGFGAVVGPLVGLLLLFYIGQKPDALRSVFYWALIPSVIGVMLLTFFVKESEKNEPKTKVEKPKFFRIKWNLVPAPLKLFLAASFLFSLGNSSDVFLILQTKNLGLTTVMTILAYVLYNASRTIFSTPAGSLADKIGAKKVFVFGLIIFALVYVGFGIINSDFWIWFLFPIYGLYIAFTDGVGKSYVAEFIHKDDSGSFFGLQQMLLAVGALFASVIGGFLWKNIGPHATFFYGAIMSFAACLLFLIGWLLVRKKKSETPAKIF